MQKAFFLDRDGTINVDYNFVHTPQEWTWCDGAVEAIRQLRRCGYKIIVVTNQSGIARGRYSEEDVIRLHRWVDRQLDGTGAAIDGWYMAPHHPDFDPEPHRWSPQNRKPGTGMFRKAARDHRIDLHRSFMAGDKISDLKPALALGMQAFLIRSRHTPKQSAEWLQQNKIPIYDRLLDSVPDLLPES